jgi:hypothetical protein
MTSPRGATGMRAQRRGAHTRSLHTRARGCDPIVMQGAMHVRAHKGTRAPPVCTHTQTNAHTPHTTLGAAARTHIRTRTPHMRTHKGTRCTDTRTRISMHAHTHEPTHPHRRFRTHAARQMRPHSPTRRRTATDPRTLTSREACTRYAINRYPADTADTPRVGSRVLRGTEGVLCMGCLMGT